MPTSDLLSQFLDQGEQILLFSNGVAAFKFDHFGLPVRSRHRNEIGGPYIGPLAITEGRIFIVPYKRIMFEVIFDSTYAKQRIESLKAKWEEANGHKSRLGIPKFEKDPRYVGYIQGGLTILTSVNFQIAEIPGVHKGEYLFLNTHIIPFTKLARRMANNSWLKIGFEQIWGIWFREPLNMMKRAEADAAGLGMVGGSAGPPVTGAAETMEHSGSKSNITNEQILQLLQVKVEEISRQVKELEDSAA
jgi:hypothetical protein